MRIIVSAFIYILCPTTLAILQLLIDFHAAMEVLLMGQMEQVSLVEQVLRVSPVQLMSQVRPG